MTHKYKKVTIIVEDDEVIQTLVVHKVADFEFDTKYEETYGYFDTLVSLRPPEVESFILVMNRPLPNDEGQFSYFTKTLKDPDGE